MKKKRTTGEQEQKEGADEEGTKKEKKHKKKKHKKDHSDLEETMKEVLSKFLSALSPLWCL